MPSETELSIAAKSVRMRYLALGKIDIYLDNEPYPRVIYDQSLPHTVLDIQPHEEQENSFANIFFHVRQITTGASVMAELRGVINETTSDRKYQRGKAGVEVQRKIYRSNLHSLDQRHSKPV